jgi:hypothetical protein
MCMLMLMLMLIFKKSNYKIENGIEVNRTPKGFNAQQLAIVLTYQCKLFQKYNYYIIYCWKIQSIIN